MRLKLVLVLLVASSLLTAQSSQETYLRAKQDFNNGEFSQAISGFAPLATDPVFGSYATFYLGLSYAKAGNYNQAIDAWRQLLIKYPAFSQTDDVQFWMTKTYFDQAELSKGMRQAQRLDQDLREDLYAIYLDTLNFHELRKLFQDNPEDKELAAMLVRKAPASELSKEDRFFLNGMTARLDITAADLGQFPDIKKEKYSVAIMLPFLFDGLENPDRTLRNTIVMDLYQGMALAQEMLWEDSVFIELFPYDTRRDSSHVKSLLKNRNFAKVDAIVGPLFPETSNVVSRFAQESKINQINPVSSNSDGLAGNPFSFILKPDHQTMARAAADFMTQSGVRREAKVYFENKPMEKALAQAYKEAIEENGYVVSEFSPIDNKSARQVLAQFTEQKEVVLNISNEEYLILKERGRQIRDRRKFDASGNLLVNEDGTPRLEYYELVFTADTDSLDHLFAATRSNLLANNFVGAVESIADTVRLLGLGDWLEFSMLDYKQLERLGVYMIHPEYKDRNSAFFKKVNERFRARYGKQPKDFALMGFEGIWWLGNMLDQHGKYFQNGFFAENDFESVMSGLRFVPGRNDNQIVPIVQFLNQELKAINLENDNREE